MSMMSEGLKGLDEFVAKHTSLILFFLGIPLSLWLIKNFRKDCPLDKKTRGDSLPEKAQHGTTRNLPRALSKNKSSSRLLSLDEELIAQLWPLGWICEGMETCKYLHRVLRKSCPLFKVRLERWNSDLTSAARWLTTFGGQVEIHVLWKQTDRDFLQLMAKAIESGWAGPVSLDCCECKWRSNDVLRFKSMLSDLQSPIQRLNLSHNILQNTGCAYLASALVSMPSLRKLSIIGCHIQGEGVWRLMPMLTMLPLLEILEMGFNPIGEGIIYVSETAPHLRSLTTLDLTHLEEPFARGGLLEDGAMVLAHALPQCPKLTRLHVAHNFVGPQGVLALVTAAQMSSSLTELDVRGNHHAHALQEISRVVEKTRCRVIL